MATKKELEQAVLAEGLFQAPSAPQSAPEPAKAFRKGEQQGEKQAALGAGSRLTSGTPAQSSVRSPTPPSLTVQGEAPGVLGMVPLPEQRNPFARRTAAKAFTAAKKTGTQAEAEILAGYTFTGDYDGIYPASEHKEAREPGTMEQLYRLLEPFDDARRALWLGLEGAGMALPSSSEGFDPTRVSLREVWDSDEGNTVGDSLSWLVANATGVMLQKEVDLFFKPLAGDENFRVAAWESAPGERESEQADPGRFKDKAPDDEMAVYQQLMANFYEALAGGELWEKAWTEDDIEAFWFYGVGRDAERKLLWAPKAGTAADAGIWSRTKYGQAPHPRGIHIIDAVVTKEEALAVAQTTNDPAIRNLMYALSSEAGRELLGASLEVAVDPLWLAGPAKGAETVAVGSKTFTLGKPLVRAAGVMEQLPLGGGSRTANELRQIIVQSVLSADDASRVGTTVEKVQSARALVVDAMEMAEGRAMLALADARAAREAVRDGRSIEEAVQVLKGQLATTQQTLDKAKELGRADQVLTWTKTMERLNRDLVKARESAEWAAGFLKGEAMRESLHARYWSEGAGHIRKVLDLGADALDGGLVSEKGRIAWHIPFGQKTHYVFKPGSGGRLAEKVVTYLPEPLLHAGSKVEDVLTPFTKEGLTKSIMELSESTGLAPEVAKLQLAGAEKLALAMHTVGGKVGNVPRWVWTALNEWFGSRFLQPLVLMTKSEVQATGLGARGASVAKIPGLNRWLVRMRRADPEVWNTYMGAVSQYLNRIDGLNAQMRVDWDRVVQEAETALKWRKRASKKLLPNLERRIKDLKEVAVPGDVEGARLLRALEERAEQMRLWKSKDYTVESVLIDAGAHIEQGSGVLGMYPELQPFVRSVRALLTKYSEETAKERGLVANALANMVRFAEGDPRKAEFFAEEMTHALMSLDELTAQKFALIEQSRRAATVELARLEAGRRLFNNVSRDRFISVLEQLRAREMNKPLSQVRAEDVFAIVREVFHDDPQAAQDLVKYAALVMRDEDGAAALLQAAHIIEPSAADYLKVHQVAPGQAGTARALRMGIAKYLDRIEDEAKLLRSVFKQGYKGNSVVIDGKVISEGMPAEAVKTMLVESSNAQLAKAKVVVGAQDWDAFFTWWKAGAPQQPGAAPLLSWSEGARVMDRSSLLRRAAVEAEELVTSLTPKKVPVDEAGRELALRLPAGLKADELGDKAGDIRRGVEAFGGLTESSLQIEKYRKLVSTASNDTEAVAKLKAALLETMGFTGQRVGTKSVSAAPVHPLVEQHAQQLAQELLRPLQEGLPLEVAQTIRSGRTAARDALKAAQERMKRQQALAEEVITSAFGPKQEALAAEAAEAAELAQANTPRIPVTPKMEREVMPFPEELSNGKQWAALQEWESSLWQEFRAATAGLSRREQLMVAFSTLDELPKILPAPIRESIEALYPSAMGQRMGELPVELQTVTQDMRRFLERYEELYQKHGMDFVKRPEDMLAVWGVAGYVPHIPTQESLLAEGGALEYVGMVAAGHKTAASRGGIEGALAMKMDARKLRQIDGTIAEVNAMRRDLSLVMTLDPMAVLARYGQANRAISGKEFMLTMMRGGVVKALQSELLPGGARKSLAQVAAEADMVPLLERRIVALEDELLFAGDRAAWEGAGVNAEELMKTLRQHLRGLKKEGVFATWVDEVPELGGLRKVEEFYTELRAREYFAGHELSDVRRMRQTGMEWPEIAEALNKRGMQVDPASFSTRKIDPDSLRQFFEDGQEAWRLYIPRSVERSLESIFGESGFERLAHSNNLTGVMLETAQRLNTWWKTRVTVMSLAFSVRNAMSNVMSNFLDLGGGALNPHTNTKGGVLTQAVMFAERYGSIEEAARVLSGPLDPEVLAFIPPARRAAMQIKHKQNQKAFRFLFDTGMPQLLGERSWLKSGIDLGDGMVRSLDDALTVMRDNGVTSQAFTQMVDMATTERHLLDAISYGKGFWAGAKRAASAAEDAVVVAWPLMMTASGGLPLLLGLPKKFGGEVVARTIENQARITNFMGNLKSSGSVQTSAAHVQKFLFNYGDLTASQKSLMRLIFPFFTWNQKNLMLQSELMVTSPVLYSQFWRLLMEDLPRIVEAYNSEYFDRPYAPAAPGTMREQVRQEAHRLHQVRLPMPQMESAYITGAGLPQEAFAEKVGLIFGTLEGAGEMLGLLDEGAKKYQERNRKLRILGEVHWLLRFMLETTFEHHSFYDKPINELTNGKLIVQSTAPLAEMGPLGMMVQAYIHQAMGLHITSDYDGRTGTFGPDPIMSGSANHKFGSLPYSRVLRDATAMTDVYATSFAADPAAAAAAGLKGGEYGQVPMWIRTMDAMSGIQVVQYDPALQDSLRMWKMHESIRENMEERGATREFNAAYISKDPKK